MLRVRFNSEEEFLEELARDGCEVDRGIVRVTGEARPLHGGAVTAMSIVATYSVAGDVVRLQRFVGELWGIDRSDFATRDRAEHVRVHLEARIRELGLEARAGVLEPKEA